MRSRYFWTCPVCREPNPVGEDECGCGRKRKVRLTSRQREKLGRDAEGFRKMAGADVPGSAGSLARLAILCEMTSQKGRVPERWEYEAELMRRASAVRP